LIGVGRANDLLLSSRVVLAEEALAMGLVNRVVDADDLMGVVREYATMLATTVSPGSLAATKRQVYDDLHRDLGAAVVDADRRLRTMMTEPNFAEGVAALVERRPPRFD
jgi:enoyl-CoA hydratase/carnithine racemase